MTNVEIKQLARREYGSMAHLGRKLSPPVTGQAVSMLIDGKRSNRQTLRQIARKLKLSVRELVAAHSTDASKASKD